MIDERSATQQEIDAAELERVTNGIALLEKEYGPNWVDKIDLDTFEFTSYEFCVLGQVYGDATPTAAQTDRYIAEYLGSDPSYYGDEVFDNGFGKAIAVIDGDLFESDGPARYGFDGAPEGEGDDYGRLSRLWREEIAARQLQRAKEAVKNGGS